MTTQAGSLETIVPGLHATSPEPLSFAPDTLIRAFLLEREHGNVLIYSNSALEGDAKALSATGVERQYLNHWHEAMFDSSWISERLDAPLFCHEADEAEVVTRRHVRGTFSIRHVLHDDLEVIPIPGHTPGATAYLWDSGSHRALFTGDSLYLKDGEWIAAVLDSSDLDAYVKSLELIRELEFDLLVPWAAGAGDLPYALTDPRDARRRLDRVIDRLRRGERS